MAPMHMLQQMGVIAILSLIVGVLPALMGVVYAARPTEAKLALMRPLSLASIFGALSGFVVGVINILMGIVPQDKGISSPMALVGIAEALVPLFVAFSALTVAWLLVALGLRRA